MVLVDGATEAAPSNQDVHERIVSGLADGEKPTHLARRLAKETGLPRQELYDRILTAKGGAAGSD